MPGVIGGEGIGPSEEADELTKAIMGVLKVRVTRGYLGQGFDRESLIGHCEERIVLLEDIVRGQSGFFREAKQAEKEAYVLIKRKAEGEEGEEVVQRLRALVSSEKDWENPEVTQPREKLSCWARIGSLLRGGR